MGALLVFAVLFPWLDQMAGWYRVSAAANSVLLIILAVGLSIVVGFAGLLDLGYAAFFAIGGYTAALLTSSGSQLALMLPEALRSPWLALPVAGLVAARLRTDLWRADDPYPRRIPGNCHARFRRDCAGRDRAPAGLDGGNRGMSGVPIVQVGPWPPGSAIGAYFVALRAAGAHHVQRGATGGLTYRRSWAAVREDDTAAAAVGVNPPLAKLQAFAIGAGCAGMAGSLFAGLFGHVEPDQFDFTISLMALAAVVIGGRWGVAGAVLGGLTVAAYQYVLVDWLSGAVRLVGMAVNRAGADVRGSEDAQLCGLWRRAVAGDAAARQTSECGTQQSDGAAWLAATRAQKPAPPSDV